jgi:RimJ/RimL family protein N-acetyltransferase
LRATSATGSVVLGAFAEGVLIGTMGLLRNSRAKTKHKAVVWGVYVAPAWRGKRVGRAMLVELITLARSQPGLDQITLTVNVQDQAAKRLYAAVGFEVYGHERHALKLEHGYIDQDHMLLSF